MKKDINIIVGKNIRIYREACGYTRENFSELIGVSSKFLYDCESGNVGISLSTFKKICEVLGISADRLLWERSTETIDLSERLSHIPPEYHHLMETLIQTQLELLALATKEPQKKTRH